MPEPLLEVKDLKIHFFTDEGVVDQEFCLVEANKKQDNRKEIKE